MCTAFNYVPYIVSLEAMRFGYFVCVLKLLLLYQKNELCTGGVINLQMCYFIKQAGIKRMFYATFRPRYFNN